MNTKVEQADFTKYLEEARSWETDKVKEKNKQLRVAYWFGGVASGVAVMASTSAIVMAFAWMNPAPPPVFRVDSSTGIVDVVETVRDGKTNYEESVNKYFTQLYVRYREGFTYELAEDYYSNVGIMSVGLEQQKYFEWFNPKNPLSPLNVFGQYAKVKVRIKSTSFIKPNVALVRYTKEIERGLDKPQVSHWAATIIFKYSGAKMKESDRSVNPLGFQVVEYRNDPDAQAPNDSTPIKQEGAQAATVPVVTVFPEPSAAPQSVPAAAVVVPPIK